MSLENFSKINLELDNRYQLIEKIDETNFSEIYKAIDKKLNRTVVIKFLLIARNAKQRDFLARFQREIEILSQINHSGIVAIYDSNLETNEPYYVMEYVHGRSFQELKLQASFSKKIDIFKKTLSIIQSLHNKNIVHRDLKPSHILISPEGSVKIIDFGISKLLDPELTQLTATDEFIGTLEYSSPEQFTGDPITIQSDIYSLGIIFYEILTGSTPFKGQKATLTHAHVYLPPPKMQLPEKLKSYEKICLNMLSKSPKDRYQSCEEILKELKKLENTRKISKLKNYLINNNFLNFKNIIYSLFKKKLVLSSLIFLGILIVINFFLELDRNFSSDSYYLQPQNTQELYTYPDNNYNHSQNFNSPSLTTKNVPIYPENIKPSENIPTKKEENIQPSENILTKKEENENTIEEETELYETTKLNYQPRLIDLLRKKFEEKNQDK